MREPGAGNVRGGIGIATGIWIGQIVPAIDQDPVRILQMACQFSRGNQRGVFHFSLYTSVAIGSFASATGTRPAGAAMLRVL